MQNLYIPPEGAMQFEVTRAGFTGDVLWVGPGRRGGYWSRPRNCSCDLRYPVLAVNEGRVADFILAKRICEPVVCACDGRVIE